MNINEYILDQRLHFDQEYEEIASRFCNLTGQKTSLTKDRYLLPAWYDGYIYTALLGIKVGYKEDFVKKIDKTSKWSGGYMKQYKYVLMKLLAKKDVLKEIGLLNREEINNEFEDVKSTLDKLQIICDKYSNGGLKYLKEQYQKNDSIFNEHTGLVEIYKNAKSE